MIDAATRLPVRLRNMTTRRPAEAFMARASREKRQPWFRIENKASSDTTEVFIYDEIGGWWGTTADSFIKELQEIGTSKIDLHLNSPGGEIFDGIAIYNALKSHDAYVTVFVDALAASAASFIAQAGDKRVMLRSSTMMIHDGLAMAYGNEQDMLDTAAILNKLSNTIADIYARRSGKDTTELWRDQMRAEVWYTADEAVEAGLADEVLDIENKDAQEATDRYDLSVFAHASRDEAPSPEEVRRMVRTISNRVKETPVTVKNEQAPDAEAPQAPATPAASVTEDAPAGAGATGDGAPIPETNAPEAPPAGGEAAPQNRVGTSFLLNGVATSDFSAVQRHITTLETAISESRDQSRKDFVGGLAAGQNAKIAASDIGELEELALSLDDKQYAAWAKSWDKVKSSGLFATHGQQDGNAGQAPGATNDLDSQIADAEAIIAHNRRGGMSQENVEKTKTWAQLQVLKNQKKEQGA